jgi:hypothetical protein
MEAGVCNVLEHFELYLLMSELEHCNLLVSFLPSFLPSRNICLIPTIILFDANNMRLILCNNMLFDLDAKRW